MRFARNLGYTHNFDYFCSGKKTHLHIMGLRIKELVKEHGYPLEAVASSLNISPVSLSQSLHGNPTLKRLEQVAEAFGVDVSELFERPIKKEIHGCLYIDGQPRLVKSKADIKKILQELESDS